MKSGPANLNRPGSPGRYIKQKFLDYQSYKSTISSYLFKKFQQEQQEAQHEGLLDLGV